MFINIDLENIKGKISLTWFQENYIRHKYNICNSLSYYNQLWKIDPAKDFPEGKKKKICDKYKAQKTTETTETTEKILLDINMSIIIPNTPHTTPRKELLSMFDDNSGWNTLKVHNSTQSTTMKNEFNIASSMRISIDRLDYQSSRRLDNISNSSNSTLNSSIGDRLSNLASPSPYLSPSPQNKTKSSSSSNSFDTF